MASRHLALGREGGRGTGNGERGVGKGGGERGKGEG